MAHQSTSATHTTKHKPPPAVKPPEPKGHVDHAREAIKDAADKIVASVEHERAEHEHAAHDGRVHHAREAIKEAVDKAGQRLPGGK